MSWDVGAWVLNTLKKAIENHGVQTFTEDGTFVVPPGVTKIYITAAGGGGGGGGGCSSDYARTGGGGGGGACIFKTPFCVTPGDEIPITIGKGGSGGTSVDGSPTSTTGPKTNGENGGATVIGSLVTLEGGGGGAGPYRGLVYSEWTNQGGIGGTGAGGGGNGGQKHRYAYKAKGGAGYFPGETGQFYSTYVGTSDSLLTAQQPGRGGSSIVGSVGGDVLFYSAYVEHAGGGGGASIGRGGDGANGYQQSANMPWRAPTAGVHGGGGGGGCAYTRNYMSDGAPGGDGIVIIEW